MVNETVFKEKTTIKILIESITASELKWNTTIGSTYITGTCPETVTQQPYIDFLIRGKDLFIDAKITPIYSTGVIEPLYYDPLVFPLFISIAPVSWDVLEYLVLDQTWVLTNYIGLTYIDDYDSTYTDSNNTVSLDWWYYYDVDGMMPHDPDLTYNCSTSFSYDKDTGILLNVDSFVDMTGEYQNTPFSVNSEYSIEKTDVSDFVEFLDEYKWYFIGGGGGLIVLIVTSTIVIRVIKRR